MSHAETMESVAAATNGIENEVPQAPSQVEALKFDFGYYALIANQTNGELKELYNRTVKNLSKELSAYGSTYHLISVYKGKKVNLSKKVSFVVS